MSLQELFQRLVRPSQAEAPLILVVAILATLLIAQGFQHIGGIAPCALCLEQRGGYWLAFGIGLVAGLLYRVAATKETPAPRVASALMTVALAYVAYLAIFHAGVEQGWWPGPASCTRSGGVGTLAEILVTEDVVLCDDIPWSLFGISIAGYNALIALALTTYSALPFIRAWKDKR